MGLGEERCRSNFARFQSRIPRSKTHLWCNLMKLSNAFQFKSMVIAFLLTVICGSGNLISQVTDQEELPAPLTPTPFQYPNRVEPPIDPALASWFEAGTTQVLGDKLRSNWVMLGEGGDLTGTILNSANDSLPLDLFALSRGMVVGQTQTNPNGSFQIAGLRQGAYTLVGYNPNRFVAFGVNLLNHRQDAGDVPRKIITRAVNYRDKHPICDLVQAKSPLVQFNSVGVYPFDENEIDQAAHFGWQGLAQFSVNSIPADTIKTQTVRLGSDGTLRGRIHQIDHLSGRPLPVTQTTVILVEQGEIVVETSCNQFGVFEFTGLPSGEFGLVAFGKNGVAALGVRCAGGLGSVSKNAPKASTKFVSSAANSSSSMTVLDLALIQTESTGWLNHYLGENQYEEALARPRPQPVKRGPCCVHCQETIIPGQHCGCHR